MRGCRRSLIRHALLGLLTLLVLSSVDAIAESRDYQLGPGDLLKITVFNYPDLATDVRISQSGNLTYPLLGQLQVTGLSTRQAETLLTERLTAGGFIRNAQVSVLVVEYQSQKISVMGQVEKPGQYALTESSRVLSLLAQAGGVINGAAADEAVLVRADGTKKSIDLTAMFNGDAAQNPAILSGDAIFVPRAPQFYIYGEVQRPGVYRLERNMSVAQAIAAGGGLTPKASERRIHVRRRDPKTKQERVSSIATTDLLLPDDVLIVRQGLF
jgi:polysaccharide export outer membrane protein